MWRFSTSCNWAAPPKKPMHCSTIGSAPSSAPSRTLGVPASDVYVDMVNFLPKYEIDATKKLFSKKTYTEVPKGFELQKNVHIRYTDPTVLDKVVTAAAAQEIYDLVKVDYFDDNPTAAYEELRQKSFEYLAKVRGDFNKAGIELDSAYAIAAENTWVAFPGNRYESYQAYSTQSFEPIDKSAAVNTVDKPVSRFYNAVPSNDYDIIIQPEILEPVIQYSYNLVVRFTLPAQNSRRSRSPISSSRLPANCSR
jgi:hypothetical protein